MGGAGMGTEAVRERMILPALGRRALSIQGMLLAASAFVLPAVAHALGLPVRLLLPMHWPVILVGLCYGWRSGAIVGLASPGISFLLSGMPLPPILPAMTLELAAYGFLAGFFRETLRLGRPTATALSLIGGRVAFVALAVVTQATGGSIPQYLKLALLPGVIAALCQLLLLPAAARSIVRHEQRP